MAKGHMMQLNRLKYKVCKRIVRIRKKKVLISHATRHMTSFSELVSS
jgi:hypothetical protein